MKRRSFLGLFLGGLAALFGLKKSPAAPVPYVRKGLELKYPHLPIIEKHHWWLPEEDRTGPFDFTGFHASEWQRNMVVGAASENDLDPLPYKPIDWSTL